MKWPSEEVSESGSLFPEGPLTIKIVESRDGESKSGCAQIEVQARILKPAEFRNQPYNFNFMVGMTAETAAKFGIEEDLQAENEETWKANPSARRYKSFLKAAGVPDTGDTEEEAEALKGRTVVVQNAHRPDRKNPSRVYNDASAFYADDGSPDKRLNGKAAAAPARSARPAAPAPKAADEGADAGGWND